MLSDNSLYFRLTGIKEKENFCISEINDREKINKTLNKYITTPEYAEKALLVQSGANGGVIESSKCPSKQWKE